MSLTSWAALLSMPLIAMLVSPGDAQAKRDAHGPEKTSKEIYSICTAFIPDGRLKEELASLAEAEKKFNANPAVISRLFFQCRTQSQIIWAVTKWTSEVAHNTAAYGMMNIRFDDRAAAAAFPEEPYFEEYERQRVVGSFYLEEYLFTGLEKPLGKTMLASYNQIACEPLDLGGAA